mmetsp:Transcript_21837/g.33596  ORF Transcript_21837/g.33596 Transcript_21837/m.33596 type:complete len:1371 (+) Transcript_21837:73-4185(+)|eukprot:CAMPEP_0197312482 /NCGR_PEP_ID=MMETSP0891-20130614/21100_1 /TAXON_ID=44058 ORGANISM="Aureoumbra lagunensis, Strain CCMP1510" /NCGR_SAMPLE_ID=MMETSP0891 /ASSEMBLY_ACC=CAM_ASM_000534 /LENGTH=1370 /DNA_ID=CAMNT_0042799675 /DNA_START=32 /DNA_END=4144 /DNA_ORIENTATION=+
MSIDSEDDLFSDGLTEDWKEYGTEERKEDGNAYEVDLDNPKLLSTKKQREGLNQDEIDMLEAVLAQRVAAMDRAFACAEDAFAIIKKCKKEIILKRDECDEFKKCKFTCRLLVKYPLGISPMEMWITAPMELGCRTTDVIECFTNKLRITKHKSSRRKLDPAGLVLVDGHSGAVISVARTLAESSIRPGDVLLLLPSISRLRFLVAETKRYADRFEKILAAGKKLNGENDDENKSPQELVEQPTTNSITSTISNNSVMSESSFTWLRSKIGINKDTDNSDSNNCPKVGDISWVQTWQIGGWRKAEIIQLPLPKEKGKSRSPPKPQLPNDAKEFQPPQITVVRWIEPKPDEPLCAQIEHDRLLLFPSEPPPGEVILDEEEEVDNEHAFPNENEQDDIDDEASVGSQQTMNSIASASSLGSCIALAPRALQEDQLRVQIVWRLGAPTEALAAWLRVPSPFGTKVKPRTLLKKFIKKLTTERTALRFRVSARYMCLATLDGAPLDETLPVAASLSAIAHKRRRALREHSKSKHNFVSSSTRKDSFHDEWREPPQTFEETLVCLPRVDVHALGVSGETARSRDDEDFETYKKAKQAKRQGRCGWVIETDGTLTACVLPGGKRAPSRNRLASASSASFSVALANTIDTALQGGDDGAASALAQDEATAHAALRVSGGDTVVVHTDRLAPGQTSKLRQVKLSQIVFEDELEAGAGPYASRGPTEDDGLGPRAAIPGLPTGLTWYDDNAAKRDMRAIDDATGKLVLQQVLPEFRKNGRLVFGDRPTACKGSVVKVVFPYKSLGISIALAQDNSKKKPRRLIVLDGISPTCPPRAQLVLTPGDELLSIDGFRVSPTLNGYQTAVAKLRCGARPIHLSFRKAKDILPKNRASLPDDDDGGHEFGDALTGTIAKKGALEVAIVDLTADDCVDVDLDDDDFDDDDIITTVTPRSLARRDQQVPFPPEEEVEEDDDDDTMLLEEASIVDLDDEELDESTRQQRLDTLEEEEIDEAQQEEGEAWPEENEIHNKIEEEKILAIEAPPPVEDEYYNPIDTLVEEDESQEEKIHDNAIETPVEEDKSQEEEVEDESKNAIEIPVEEDKSQADEEEEASDDYENEDVVDMDALDDDDDDDDKARYLVPIVRSGELTAGEPDDRLFVPVDKFQKLTDVETIPFEATPKPLKPLAHAAKAPSDFSVALLEPASPLARRLHRRDAPIESPEDVQCVIYDRLGRYRSCVCQDLSVRNNRDELLGYVNEEMNQAGSATEDFLGELEPGARADILIARGPFDEVVANCDLGTMRISGAGNSTIAELTRSGDIVGNEGTRLGQISPFNFQDFNLAALYMLFLDPGILSNREIEEEPDPYSNEPLSPLTVDTTMH